MSSPSDPLVVEYGAELSGLRVVRQPPPPAAASFSATYVGPAGWGYDPHGSEGVARLVNQLVVAAAGRRDRVELARALDRAGATLGHQCSPESAEVTIWGPATDWVPLMGILADVVLRPRFDPGDVARVRRQLLERQLRERTQPGARADRELLGSIFPRGHPYRETGLGDARSVRRIGRVALARFHEEHYSSGDALLAVTGPARAEEVDRVARRLFGRFAREKPPTLEIPSVPRRGPSSHAIRLPGRSQVEVRVGGPSLARTDPQYAAAFLANELLGGRPLLSRLFQRVREKGGLAYHASSEVEAMRWGGYWAAQAGTGADRWRKVVPMLRDEVGRLRREPVAPKELKVIRESAIGEIPLALESTAEAHELAVDVAYHRLPADHWRRWPARLRRVTTEEIRAAAASALDLRSAVTVVAGPVPAR